MTPTTTYYPERKRLCELQVNDCFDWGGLVYMVVLKSKKEGIVFKQAKINDGSAKLAGSGVIGSFGIGCQMKVLFIKTKRASIIRKPVIQLDKRGNEIKTFPSISGAAKELNIWGSDISDCARGIIKTSGGFKWKFKAA